MSLKKYFRWEVCLSVLILLQIGAMIWSKNSSSSISQLAPTVTKTALVLSFFCPLMLAIRASFLDRRGFKDQLQATSGSKEYRIGQGRRSYRLVAMDAGEIIAEITKDSMTSCKQFAFDNYMIGFDDWGPTPVEKAHAEPEPG